jgi:hypothetical protein
MKSSLAIEMRMLAYRATQRLAVTDGTCGELAVGLSRAESRALAGEVGERPATVVQCRETLKELALVLPRVAPGDRTPRDDQLANVGELPDIAAAPVSHPLAGTEARVLAQPRAQGIGLANVERVRVRDPVVRQNLDRDGRVASLEVAGQAGVVENRIVECRPMDEIGAGMQR